MGAQVLALSGLYDSLACPSCGASPRPAEKGCPGCGRPIVAPGGGLDLLSDESRAAGDIFASQYRALRTAEGWVGESGREDPVGGPSNLWRGRVKSVADAAAILARECVAGARPIVADIGSGGGWAERLLRSADVIAIDLVGFHSSSGLNVRGDMRSLPLRNQSVDAALYAASLHYAPLTDVIREAARVLRPGALLIAVDSPIYPDPQAQARAVDRAAAYYRKAGHPDLAAYYHPIDAGRLHSVLKSSGFDIERFDLGSHGRDVWRRLGRRSQTSFVVARRTIHVAPSPGSDSRSG